MSAVYTKGERLARLALAMLASQKQSSSNEIAALVYFDYQTQSSTLTTLSTGAVINRAVVLVDVPFDGVSPMIELGTNANPGEVFGFADVDLMRANQYETCELHVVDAPDVLRLTTSFGSASQGRGFILFKMLL